MNWLPILLFLLAGFLVGGVVSFVKQGNTVGAVVLGVLSLGCAAGGVLWLI